MFQRKIQSFLQNWKKSSSRKPLVLRGARQVGKTTAVEIFAKEFDTFLHLNLERKADYDIFEQNSSAEDVLTAIHLLKNKVKKDGHTLLFIDEIQTSPKAVALLRYFYEDIPELYVISAGSLLETLLDTHISFPVGRVEYLALHPCSFSEFLGAIGEEQIRERLLEGDLPLAIHERVLKLYNEYVIVGGMPEAVSHYVEHRDFVALRRVYDSLLTGYADDTEKYAKNDTEKKVLRHILTYGWNYAGQRIKFERFGGSNYKSREMGEAFRALEKAMLLELSYPTTSTDMPLLPDFKKSPKLLWLDTGLVNYVSGNQQELFGTTDISEHFKGNIAEHIVGQNLLSAHESVAIRRNFWVRNALNSQAEVDYVMPYKNRLIPIEVKSGSGVKMKSLHLFMEESAGDVAVRFWNNPLSTDNIELPSGKSYTLINVPYYYAECLETILEKYA